MKKINKIENRRDFIKSTGIASAGIAFTGNVIARPAGLENLALNGGPKAVTASHEDSQTWPRRSRRRKRSFSGNKSRMLNILF